jgi:hypothetical protein
MKFREITSEMKNNESDLKINTKNKKKIEDSMFRYIYCGITLAVVIIVIGISLFLEHKKNV